MIAKLKGIIDFIDSDWAIVDVNGVGYRVFCSVQTLSKMTVGEAFSLSIETHVREDHIHLFGFSSEEEKRWFNLLTSVQGVGVKVGLAILSVVSADNLVQAIAAGDKTVITRASGVGPKLAARIITELKDKVGGMVLAASTESAKVTAPVSGGVTAPSGAMEDAVSALVNLGYQRMEAFSVAGRVAGKLGDKATSSEIIREALKELGSNF